MSDILSFMDKNVLLADGAMGTKVQQYDLEVKKDYWNCENCTDVLSLSRPDVIQAIHASYYEAGADAVETNSFGGSALTLQEFDLGDKCFELNKKASEIAHAARANFKDGRIRFVLGSVGPGTRLPSLGHVSYRELEASFFEQCCGLLIGGCDAILIETCQDPLQAKAAINAASRAMSKTKQKVPIFCQVTMETTGTMLIGSDISAAVTILGSYPQVSMLGLNCATGPQEMLEAVTYLSSHWQGRFSVLPNAGLPEVVDGKAHYPLDAPSLAHWLERFTDEFGASMIGGCCGTNETHIKALDDMLKKHAPTGSYRPSPKKRRIQHEAAAASLYHAVGYRQENAFFNIGERCNANGSALFRSMQEKEDWDGCVQLAKAQVKEGAHGIDLCTAFVGRNEKKEMNELARRMRGAITAPLVIDSTEYEVLEEALSLYGGKAIINSFNFEDGEETAYKRVELARRFGCGLIGLTIDEDGMAKQTDKKLALAHRLHDFACVKHGLPSHDLFIDPLTFTICTGNEEDRRHGVNTLRAMERIAKELPAVQIILGLSNISFGLNPAARHLLNSVFLAESIKHGMTAAIVHVSRLEPLHRLDEEARNTALDLIYDKSRDDYNPLQKLLTLFADKKSAGAKKREKPRDVQTRLKWRIIDGENKGLEKDLEEARGNIPPLDIINKILLDGMKVVGELFGKGEMQLPFVLQSAEVMKQAVRHLEPFLEKKEGESKGVMVLATVKGDVHDIGKNLVDIILSNNGYRVINLGIKQPLDAILSAAQEHKADAIGMSGLLVKSTVIMRDNLKEMAAQKLQVPVILGGAALNRRYVAEECAPIYEEGGVAYAQDAFEGLRLMDCISNNEFDQVLQEQQVRASRQKKARPKEQRPIEMRQDAKHKKPIQTLTDIPQPPFWGEKIISHVPIKTLLPYLNKMMLYRFHWGYRKHGKSHKDFQSWSKQELDPILHSLVKQCEDESIMVPQASYGYWRCVKDKESLILFDDDAFAREVARFDFPRSDKGVKRCISDFFRTRQDGGDVIALQLVSIGERATQTEQEWFKNDRYRDYLYLHGLGVELAEAMAEYVHRKIRHELGFAKEDSDDPQKLIKQHYHGARYSFGYPACPNLADQKQLLELLSAHKINVSISEEDQLAPEQSTSAIVVHHPQAHYFII